MYTSPPIPSAGFFLVGAFRGAAVARFMSLARYAGVGAVATATHYLILILWVEALGLEPGLGAAAGAVVGAVVAYVGNRRLTFQAHAVPHGRALPRFAAVSAVGAVLNGLVVASGVALGMHYLPAQAVATALVMLLTYHVNRWWTFS